MSESTREAPNDNDLEKRIDRMLNQVVDSGANVLTKSVSYDPNTGIGAMAYFTDGGNVLTKSETEQLSKILGRNRELPKGYRPLFKSFGTYLKSGLSKDPDWFNRARLAEEQLQRSGAIFKANAYSSVDSDSAGALVLPEFAPEIADILYDDQDLFGMTDSYTISGDSIKLPKVPQRSRKAGSRNSGVTAGWPDQGDLIDIVRGKIDQTALSLNKLACVVFLNSELISDNSYALEQWVKRSVGSEMKFILNDSIVSGTGVGMPLGYNKSPRVLRVTRTTANVIEAKDVLEMYSHRIPGVPLSEYEWHINQECEKDLQMLTLGTGGSQLVVYTPPGGLSVAPYSTLMGLRVRTMEYCEARGTPGDIALVRMKGMASISKGGINEMASSHVAFLRDQEAIRFTTRVDARPMYDAPTLAYKGSNNFSYSDFITLT